MGETLSTFDCNASCNKTPNIVVLGIGNLLWADEGFGVRCVETLQERYEFSENVQLIDGGTQGLYLIQFVQTADYLLIFDAIDYGLTPGTLKLVRNEEVPKFLGAKKMSLHQTGFQEVLALAQLTGNYPKELLLIGCQPEELEDYGGSLRDVVKAAMQPALQHAVDNLRKWGVTVHARQTEIDPEDALSLPHLTLHHYETGRPSAESACRTGDSRFLPIRESEN